jgi:hypothetical protein
MADLVALLGLVLFYASCLWLPVVILRAILNRGHAQTWSIAALLTFGLSFMGYTRAMANGNAAEAFAWSISWAMPLGLALYARMAPDAEFRRVDLWLGVMAALSFLPVAPLLPAFLHGAAALIWS